MSGGCEVMINPSGILDKVEPPSGAMRDGRIRQLIAPSSAALSALAGHGGGTSSCRSASRAEDRQQPLCDGGRTSRDGHSRLLPDYHDGIWQFPQIPVTAGFLSIRRVTFLYCPI
jgi:hypothetical protein